ncbi:MAG: DUF2804 domain-containing protein [Proteobacteria bacterium]|nr:DUF2804 domain-containing protein [Pseudomonadota bacterium]MBU1584541.1 DUF2804 domain-containing protein [Pseudomonadota bacterium]MBU2456241.1 DUF2804 domain-containing protein [Pseudomonadota bacterium]MBU2630536.1 DUF2804 domain-containing protein [Pseudomonadota bacterium]
MNKTNQWDKPSAIPHGAWSGEFNHPDTRGLLNLQDDCLSFKRFREKRWCYMGIIHPDIIFGCAVIHLGYIASAFAFGFDRQQKKMIQHSQVFVPLGQVRYDQNPETGVCSYKGLWNRLILTHDKNKGKKKIHARFYRPGRSLSADLDVIEPDGGISPMNFLMLMKDNRSAFTTKIAGLKARGQITLHKKCFDLASENTFAVFDWTHGFYPRKTSWNWACGAGFADDGTRVGFNFSSGVYENGLLENTVWINGTPFKTGDIIFTYDPSNPENSWQIKTKDDLINLKFKPEGIRRANDNLGIIKSRFIQPCGSFEGSIQTMGKIILHLSCVGGVVEEHFAKW